VSRWRWIALYAGVGVVSYLLFFFLTLPREQIGEYLASRVATAVPGVTIALTNPAYSFPAGLTADRMEIVEARADTPSLTMSNVSVSPSLWGLLTGGMGGGLTGELGKGSFAITASQTDTGGEAHVELDNASLSHIGVVGQFVGDSSVGSGTVDVTFAEPWQTTLQGSANLTINNIVISSAAVPSMLIPELPFDDALLDVEMTDGVMSCAPCSFTGPLVNVVVEGTMKMASSLPSSQVSVHVVLAQPTGKENPMLGMLDAMGNITKDAQGRYNLRLEGPLRSPKIVP